MGRTRNTAGALLLPLALWGCGAGTDANGAADGVISVDAMVAAGTSAYIVPGPPDVRYPIEPAEVTVEGGELRIGYNLPALLVGSSQRVSLRFGVFRM